MTEVYAGIMNKKGRNHKSKKVKAGKCVFPFIYKNKEYSECLDTGNGAWCPTSLTNKNRVKEWGYCVEKDVSNAANILTSLKNKKAKKSKKGGNRMVLPSEYFGVKSGHYVGGKRSKGKEEWYYHQNILELTVVDTLVVQKEDQDQENLKKNK